MKKPLVQPRHRILQRVIVCGSAALLAACADFKGIPQTASLKALPSTAGASLSQPTADWPSNQWASNIGGTALQNLIDQALAEQPSLQAAAARVRAAQAVNEVAGAGDKPSFGITFNNTYQRFTEHGMIPPPYGGTFMSDNTLAFNVAYEVDFWGKHSAEMRSALSQEQVALAEQQSACLLLSSAIAHAWLQLARQNAQLQISKQQLEQRSKLDQLIQQRVKAGLDNESDIQSSLVQIANLNTEISQWQEAIALTRNQLAALAGQPPEFGKSIEAPSLDKVVDQGVPANLPADLLGHRPDVVAARWRVEANQGDIDVAKNLFYPNINLVGFAGLSSLGIDNLLKGGSAIIGGGPAVRIPIFIGGRLRGNLKAKIAAYDASVALYNQSLTDALRDVADQVQSLQAISQIENNLRTAELAAQKNVQLAQQREKIGTANALPILAAQINLLAQQKALIDTRIRRSDVTVNLIKALGGGYQGQLPNTVAESTSKQTQLTSTTEVPQ